MTDQVKKKLLLAIATVIAITSGNPWGDGLIAYAAKDSANVGELDVTAVTQGNNERIKADFAYEMAQITTKIISAPNGNVESFKVEFAYATAQVTAKVMPLLPADQRNDFAYEMAQITTKIIKDPNLDVERAKAEFAYKAAQLTTKIIAGADRTGIINNTPLDRDNKAVAAPKAIGKDKGADNGKKPTGNVTKETYNSLVDELMHVGDRSGQNDQKINIDGELRYHYAFNRGSDRLNFDSSGLRLRLGLESNINKDWQFKGMLESEKNFAHYNNELQPRLSAVGKLEPTTTLTLGSFGYTMAEGNIYDSIYKGARLDFGQGLKYTVGIGATDFTSNMYILGARYRDFDYSLESGLYHFQKDDGVHTIWTLGGRYYFNDFSLGAMYLGSSQKDANGASNGYVYSFNYGDLKTYRPGTYEIVAKYLNQSQGTYIEYPFYGLGGLMQGFKGHALGTGYTLANNLVFRLEYWDLTDKVQKDRGKTWWSDVTYYW